ncbi:hypothetical protein, partial [Burkholderia sp. Ap-962]|uniref:hypothetical protein n=1 Tax=Burkholderia sp. Ap-962 TaxID=2608333 RepID=UPI0019648F37
MALGIARLAPNPLISCPGIASASRCLMSASCPARDARPAARRHLGTSRRHLAPASLPASGHAESRHRRRQRAGLALQGGGR